jgi:putative ABC transport system permease protein
MNSLKYILRNVRRNKLRSLLTMLSIGFSLALLTILLGYLAMQAQWGIEADKHHRIVVMSSSGFAGAVPISYVDRVRDMPDIQACAPFSWFGGTYKEQQMAFAQFGTDPKHVFNVWPEYVIDPEQLKEFQNDRQACVADRRLANRMKWNIGDRIPLKGTFYDVALDLKLVGLFDAPQTTDSLWFDLEYLSESLRAKGMEQQSSNAGTIFAKTKSPDVMAAISKEIDDRFSSSDNPTRTQTETAFAQIFTDMLGNIQTFILVIGLAVVFALSLVAATAMAMSMRERTTEVAVLKAIGFSRMSVLVFVLGEACCIALLGGLFGLGMGCLCLQGLHGASAQFFPFSVSEFAGPWMLNLLAAAAGIGIVSGLVPAIRAAQLSVVDGLRRVI